ncbi:hypothetical protein CHS0354_042650 [Potamilus streckersoni]|uniref:G-protein coupled receptors family 1 profile domain-containing protein n=1 Tax=Potamilus streckersoni TaxID=2493646 RepID=A0AAE0TDZ1_9BIVA|nr:hypothetical protein CHS0354_042650 [Potamilus streckersoni]
MSSNSGALVASLATIGGLAIFVNTIFIIVFFGWKSLCTSPNYLLVNVAIDDILFVLLWISFTVVSAAQNAWILPEKVQCSEKSKSGGAIILEENYEAKGGTYSDRLKRQQMKFKDAGMKKKTPVLQMKETYISSGSNISSNDEKMSSDEDSLLPPGKRNQR